MLRFWILGVWIATAASARPFADALSPSDLEKIDSLLKLKTVPGQNLEAAEQEYQRIVQRQTLADLARLYDPANADKLQVSYATFTPEWDGGPQPAKPGLDLGFGLHVVKRLELPWGDGRVKVIEVNEEWPIDRRTGAIFLPDGIRVKMLARDGERHVPGSHELYLFDSFRVAWSENNSKLSLLRGSRYRWDAHEQKLRHRALRVRVSAPYSCMGCHASPAVFTHHFDPDRSLDYERIVPAEHFSLPLDRQKGAREYMKHLRELGTTEEFQCQVYDDLMDPKRSMRVPLLLETVKGMQQHFEFSWMGDDGSPYGEPVSSMWYRQGVYLSGGVMMLDALEDVFEGKYRWWFPQPVVPSH